MFASKDKLPRKRDGLENADEALATDEGLNWRKAPGEFGIGGRYPVKEVFAAAAGTWRGAAPHSETSGTPHFKS